MCNGHTMTDQNDDDQRWLETVLTGLEERSEAVKQTLLKAVMDSEPTVAPVRCANPSEIAETRDTDPDAYLAAKQSPLTRSTLSQPPENQQKSDSLGVNSHACATRASYKRPVKSKPTLSNRSKNRPGNCHTRASYKSSARGLWLRGSIYQYRVRVPCDLRAVMGCVHVNRSLRTDSHSLALRLSAKVAFEIEVMFEQKRRECGLPVDDRLLAFSDSVATVASTIRGRSEVASASMNGLTLSQVYERYLQDPTKRRSERTMLAHHTTRRVVEDVLGPDKLLVRITREDCRDLFETLRWLPVNLTKKFGDIRVREAARAAKADVSIRTINATNLNAYMARFATMLNWAVAEEYLGRNPARGLQLAETVHPQDRRKPFEPWQLRRIFHAPIYTGCKDEEQGYAIAGNIIASGARYWVPLICLFSGMRLNEACQLDVTDVRELEGVLCFVITESSLSGSRDKSLKTKSSERIVPAHPMLHELGIEAFVQRKQAEGAIKLFDDVPPGRRGFRSVAFSRWFSRFLVSVNAASDRTCFHSFRHGFRDAARNAQIDRDIALRLGGWITGGSSSLSADDYGSGFRPQVLYEAISAVEYPDLDLNHLGRSRKLEE